MSDITYDVEPDVALYAQPQVYQRRWLLLAVLCLSLVMVVMAVSGLNVALPTGLSSPRGSFNYDWITLLVMVVVAIVGAVLFLARRPDRRVGRHLHDELEPTGAERHE